VSEVNKLLDQFRQMQKMMKQLGAGSGGGGGKMGLPPGMMGGLR
jgi:signal recognition particle subunit SRP54